MDLHQLSEPIAQGRTAEIFDWDDGRVLKLFRAGFSQGDAEYEFSIAQAIDRCNLPAPRVFDLVSVENRPGIIYERVDGISMLHELTSRPWRVTALARMLAELHVQIHQRRPNGLPRQRERFERWIRRTTVTEQHKEAILQKIAELPDADALCHGDFHPDNVILSPGGPRIIDWTNAAVGNSLGDVGWTSLLMRIGTPPSGIVTRWLVSWLRRSFHDSYLGRYFERHPQAREQFERWTLPVAAARLGDGIPDERETLTAMIHKGVQSLKYNRMANEAKAERLPQ